MLFGGKHLSCFKKDFYVVRELNNIFHVKGLIRFTFYDVKLIDGRRKNLTWKKNVILIQILIFFQYFAQ